MVCAISVVIPAYNEERCLGELHERLSPVLRDTGLEYEILFVDDGSTDGTFRELSRLSREDGCVRALRLSRNFGHQAALTAGMARARGEAVVTMDADLQHPPELIPDLVAKWRAGNEVVYTVRRKTADSGLSKDMTANLYYRLLNFLSPISIVPGAADFRLLDRKAVDALNAMPERARFFRGLVPWIGFRQTAVTFDAPERFSGETKYSFLKMFRLALHGILSLSAMPLRMATLVGATVVAIGLVYGVYVVWTATFNPESQQGWASIILVALLLGGTQIFFMGVIGEYLARVFEEVKGRPLYLVAETVGEDLSDDEGHEPAQTLK
jgi:polyisoprenyl-phosphate glycosyltransferase